MKNKQLKKGQHYVPQVYLRNFSPDRNGDESHIWEYNKCSNSFAYKMIANVCKQNFMYDIKNKEAKEILEKLNSDIRLNDNPILDMEQPLENFFADYVESKLFNELQNIIGRFNANSDNIDELNKEPLSANQIYTCCLYMVYQWMRTPTQKANLDKMTSDSRESITKILDAFEGDQSLTQKLRNEMEMSLTKFARKRSVFDLILDEKFIKGMANIFSRMYKWVIMYSDNDIYFATSDNPPILNQHYNMSGDPLFFPISSRLCFYLISEESKEYSKYISGTYVYVPPVMVSIINLYTYQNAKDILLLQENNNNNIRSTLQNKKS